mmetsp:Transcript_86803/g.281078  ORF Transcript_86803/g.281078 Transcript_86803/m.281078 type:complete len:424 (-) Transcript_86803:518-1789(-)
MPRSRLPRTSTSPAGPCSQAGSIRRYQHSSLPQHRTRWSVSSTPARATAMLACAASGPGPLWAACAGGPTTPSSLPPRARPWTLPSRAPAAWAAGCSSGTSGGLSRPCTSSAAWASSCRTSSGPTATTSFPAAGTPRCSSTVSRLPTSRSPALAAWLPPGRWPAEALRPWPSWPTCPSARPSLAWSRRLPCASWRPACTTAASRRTRAPQGTAMSSSKASGSGRRAAASAAVSSGPRRPRQRTSRACCSWRPWRPLRRPRPAPAPRAFVRARRPAARQRASSRVRRPGASSPRSSAASRHRRACSRRPSPAPGPALPCRGPRRPRSPRPVPAEQAPGCCPASHPAAAVAKQRHTSASAAPASGRCQRCGARPPLSLPPPPLPSRHNGSLWWQTTCSPGRRLGAWRPSATSWPFTRSGTMLACC